MKNNSVVKQIRNKAIIDTLVTPFSFIPTVFGSTLLMIAMALATAKVFLWGFGFLLLGLGIAATNFFLNFESITEKAVSDLEAIKAKEKNKKLNDLASKLMKTYDTKDEKLLKSLRDMYDSLAKDIKAGEVDITVDIVQQVDKIFDECVEALEYSYRLHKVAATLPGENKKTTLRKRNEVLKEVQKSIRTLTDMIITLRTFDVKEQNLKLSSLRKDLQDQLLVAQAAKSCMMEIDYGSKIEDYSFGEEDQ